MFKNNLSISIIKISINSILKIIYLITYKWKLGNGIQGNRDTGNGEVGRYQDYPILSRSDTNNSKVATIVRFSLLGALNPPKQNSPAED